MSGGRRGASNGVLRAMGLDGKVGPHVERSVAAIAAETARCQICRSELDFSTGDYGQSLERCRSRRCPNSVPHRPRPDTDVAPRGKRIKRRRAGGASILILLCLVCLAIGFVVGLVCWPIGGIIAATGGLFPDREP